MKKTCYFLFFTFLLIFNGNVNSQTEGTIGIPCDSLKKSKIEIEFEFRLSGRFLESFPKPENENCEIGKYVFDFSINKDGKIINTKFNKKMSSEISDTFKEKIIDCIKTVKFSSNKNAPKTQKGTFIFNTILKE